MTNSLLTHEVIKTTLPKAKELRRVAEPMITLAKEPTLANRRLAFNRLRDRDVVMKLFNEWAGAYQARPGGYLRILTFGFRVGDKAPMALVSWSTAPRAEAATPRPRNSACGEEEGRALRPVFRSSSARRAPPGLNATIRRPCGWTIRLPRASRWAFHNRGGRAQARATARANPGSVDGRYVRRRRDMGERHVLESKAAARGGLRSPSSRCRRSPTGFTRPPYCRMKHYLGSRAGYLQPVRRGSPYDLCRLRRRQVDCHQGIRPQRLQGLQAAGRRPEPWPATSRCTGASSTSVMSTTRTSLLPTARTPTSCG